MGAGQVRGLEGITGGEGKSRDRGCDAVMKGSNAMRQTRGRELMHLEDQGKGLQVRLSIKY